MDDATVDALAGTARIIARALDSVEAWRPPIGAIEGWPQVDGSSRRSLAKDLRPDQALESAARFTPRYGGSTFVVNAATADARW